MAKRDVFISYKSEEEREALWLKSELERKGISCWVASVSIPGAADYATEIPRAIQECTAFVLVLSRRSQESRWVRRELDKAVDNGKPVMPFMIEDFELNETVDFLIATSQRYLAYKGKAAAVDKLARDIASLIKDPEPEPVRAVPPQPEKDRGTLGGLVVGSIIADYLLCIPAGVLTTITFLIGCRKPAKRKLFFILTLILAAIGLIVGAVLLVFGFAPATQEALCASLIGWIVMLSQ